MLRGGALLGLGLLSACGPTDGGIAAFAHYEVVASAVDEPHLNDSGFGRSLDFSFDTTTKSRAQCASFRGMTATFAGRPIELAMPGGWTTSTIPTNTAPGETVSYSFCDTPFIHLSFDAATGEPQNGLLAFDGAGAHLEVMFHHDLGSPTIALVSTAASQIVVSLRGFVVPPVVDDVTVTLLVPAPPPSATYLGVVLPKAGLSADGQLTVTVPTGTVNRATSTTLTVDVKLGTDVLPCQGFGKCSGTTRLYRNLDIDLPGP
jgi:hypothetical protein